MQGTPQEHEKNVVRSQEAARKGNRSVTLEVSKEDREMIEKDLIQFSRKTAEFRRQYSLYASSSITPSVDGKASVFSSDM